jgi:hypothetical protein
MEKLPVLANIKDLGIIVEARNDFYKELNQLKEDRASLISPRDEAYARLQTRGKENIGKEYGTWTTAGFEYIKGELPILRLNSRLLNPNLAKQAVEANINGNYFSTDSTKEYELSLKQAQKDKNKDPIERNVIILPSRNNFRISGKENREISEAILKDQAEPYFELNNSPITVYPVSSETVDNQNGTILTQLWFRNLGGGSGFLGSGRYLGGDSVARGVRLERETQKISEGYTTKQISKILKKEGITGDLERRIISNLKQI